MTLTSEAVRLNFFGEGKFTCMKFFLLLKLFVYSAKLLVQPFIRKDHYHPGNFSSWNSNSSGGGFQPAWEAAFIWILRVRLQTDRFF